MYDAASRYGFWFILVCYDGADEFVTVEPFITASLCQQLHWLKPTRRRDCEYPKGLHLQARDICHDLRDNQILVTVVRKGYILDDRGMEGLGEIYIF